MNLRPTNGGGVKKAPSVLIADDDLEMNTMLRDQLLARGFQVYTAPDGVDTLKKIEREPIDILVLDIMMPRMGGFPVLKHVKEKFPHMKVVVLTGYGDLANAMEAKRLGADDFVGKPYQLEDLLFSFERLLGV